MTDPNYTHIAVVLDRSGSMGGIAEATMAAFNAFITEQKKLPGRATLTLVTFNDYAHWIHSMLDLANVEPLTSREYHPSGNTALLDAIGATIKRTGEQLRALHEDQRPARVLMVIQTDGYENASDAYSQEKAREMISHQREKYHWEFIFLGAEENTFLVAGALNIVAANTMVYQATASGIKGTMSSLNHATTSYRSGGSAAIQ